MVKSKQFRKQVKIRTDDKNKNKTDEADGKIKAVQKIGKNTY